MQLNSDLGTSPHGTFSSLSESESTRGRQFDSLVPLQISLVRFPFAKRYLEDQAHHSGNEPGFAVLSLTYCSDVFP